MNRLLLLLGICFALTITSCNKHDHNGHHEAWQIKKISRGPGFEFRYNDRRLLTTILTGPTGIGPNLGLAYDSQERLTLMRDSLYGVNHWFIYEADRLVRVDERGPAGGLSNQTFFTYDAKGRIIKKQGNAYQFNYVTYLYEGNSKNYRWANYYFMDPSPTNAKAAVALEPEIKIEFTYDNKDNPYTTWRNMPIVPTTSNELFGLLLFEPIVPNNPVKISFYARLDTGYVRFHDQEYKEMKYEKKLPVSYTLWLRNNPNGDPGPWIQYPNYNTYYKVKW